MADATPAENDAPPRALLDLSSDVLLLIFTHLDENALLRCSALCESLCAVARSPALWRPALARFFDGELPPDLVGCANPMQSLRSQVEFARRLTASERAERKFQVHEVVFPGCREWMKSLDSRIADLQIQAGRQEARPGHPYYGCSGGAYSESLKAYGRDTSLGVMTNGTAKGYGVPEAESRLLVWVDTAGKTTTAAALALSGADFGPLAEWKDGKLTELAANAGYAQLANSYEAERAAAKRDKKGGLYKSNSYTGAPDVHVSEDKKRAPPTAAVSLPKLLAGLYGGLFSLNETGTSIGTIYSLSCPADSTSIADYGDM